MHGRPRPPKDQPEDPEKQKLASKRLTLFSRLCNEVLARRSAKRFDDESLALAGALLEQNPEVYTAWNFRREALQAILKGECGTEEAQSVAQGELELTEKALRKNPKSYAAWFHRRWVVQHRQSPLDKELALVDKLLDADERNFHGWGYRQVIVQLAEVPAAADEAYIAARIGQNFSNYSAWHARTALLQRLHASSRTVTLEQLLVETNAYSPGGSAASMVPTWALREEYALVQQAFFTDPMDQSAWLYHRWLLGGSLAHYAAALCTAREGAARQARSFPAYVSPVAVLEEELAREASMCEELLAVEPDRSLCKWPLLTLARLREAQAMLHRCAAQGAAACATGDHFSTCRGGKPEVRGSEANASSGITHEGPAEARHRTAGSASGVGEKDDWQAGATGCSADIYRELLEVDPLRQGYYRDELEGHAQVVTRPMGTQPGL